MGGWGLPLAFQAFGGWALVLPLVAPNTPISLKHPSLLGSTFDL